jgi:hypothetical protein
LNNRIHEGTKPIFQRLNDYCAEFAEHPLFLAARDNRIPLPLLHEFAFYQYSDSILWIPMLALMKSKAVRSPRLRRAIEENICCEAGLGTTAHVQLAGNLLRSLGIFSVEAFPTGVYAESASWWLSHDFAEVTESETAGWLLVAETLVPIMFAEMKVCFDRLDGCDTAYFAEHVTVDTDEHSAWMAEAVEEVIGIFGPKGIPDAIAGMEDAWRETLEVPDQLCEKLLALKRHLP